MNVISVFIYDQCSPRGLSNVRILINQVLWLVSSRQSIFETKSREVNELRSVNVVGGDDSIIEQRASAAKR